MPNRDCTGPDGRGSRRRRFLGRMDDFFRRGNYPEYDQAQYYEGYGRGAGRGQGYGRGNGRSSGHGQGKGRRGGRW